MSTTDKSHESPKYPIPLITYHQRSSWSIFQSRSRPFLFKILASPERSRRCDISACYRGRNEEENWWSKKNWSPTSFVEILKNMPSATSICSPPREWIRRTGIKHNFFPFSFVCRRPHLSRFSKACLRPSRCESG